MATVQTFKKQYSFKAWIAAAADPGEGPGRLGPPLCLDHNEARRTEKKNLGVRPPPSSQGLMTTPLPPPPFSEGLDPPLCSN